MGVSGADMAPLNRNGRKWIVAVILMYTMLTKQLQPLAFPTRARRTFRATMITEVRAVSMDRGALRAWIADRPEVAEQPLRVRPRLLTAIHATR